MRPHKIHVEQGPEYNGETYIWCDCLTPEGVSLNQRYGNGGNPHLFDSLFEGESLRELAEWLQEHQQEEAG